MTSLADAVTGQFKGNCLSNDTPPPGQMVIAHDPPEGMDDPHYLEGEWVPGDPPQEAAPEPSPASAWAELINAPVYGRIYQLAQAAPPIALEMALFANAFHAHNLLPPDQWQSSLSASGQRLANLVQSTTAPLTPDEQQWIEDWSTAHNLGLQINWEIA